MSGSADHYHECDKVFRKRYYRILSDAGAKKELSRYQSCESAPGLAKNLTFVFTPVCLLGTAAAHYKFPTSYG